LSSDPFPYIEPSQEVRPIENKWIFKKKIDMNDNITVYKVRLVVKDFHQIQWVDYDETFSFVAIFKSIQILLAIAIFYDYAIWQMNVKIIFLNGNLEEKIYMKQLSVLLILRMLEKYASFSGSFMDSSKH
jgi:Reverse transcriptase (RNA-dependent DNA polymerase)